MHISREEFDAIIAKGGMFKLSDDMFYGTIEQFEDCFFSNADYDSIIGFADDYDCTVSEYTYEEYQEYLESK
jgi:hypothetical protein